MLARLLTPALLPLALGTINTSHSSSWTQYRNEATPAIAATWDSVEWIPVPERGNSLHMARLALPDTKLFITACGSTRHLSTDMTSKME